MPAQKDSGKRPMRPSPSDMDESGNSSPKKTNIESITSNEKHSQTSNTTNTLRAEPTGEEHNDFHVKAHTASVSPNTSPDASRRKATTTALAAPEVGAAPEKDEETEPTSSASNAAESTADGNLRSYMSVQKYEKTIPEVPSTKSDSPPPQQAGTTAAGNGGKRSRTKETNGSEEEEVNEMKKSFLVKYPFVFQGQSSYDNFVSYKKVYNMWEDALPPTIRKAETPVTADTLKEAKTTVAAICKEFFRKMDIGVKPESSAVPDLTWKEATLFLLQRSLKLKFILEEYLEEKKAKLLLAHESENWAKQFPCPVACIDEMQPIMEGFHLDAEEKCTERDDAKKFFDLCRNIERVLFIGGESGSGKTHLALNIYTMYKQYCKKKKRTRTLQPFEKNNEHLTVYIKIDSKGMQRYKELLSAEREKSKSTKMMSEEEKKKEASMTRNRSVTQFTCDQICAAAGITEKEAMNELEKVKENTTKAKNNISNNPSFRTTFVVLDEVVSIPDIIAACTPSETIEGLLDMIKKTCMSIFFGKIYIICSSTCSKDFYRIAGSFPENMISIQMGPSLTLFNMLTQRQYITLFHNPFFYIVYNRRCAKYAADMLEDVKNAADVCKDESQQKGNEKPSLLSETLPNTYRNYFAGHVVIHAAQKYRAQNGLALLTEEEARQLLLDAVRTFLMANSNSQTKGLLFKNSADDGLPLTGENNNNNNDPILCGVVEVNEKDNTLTKKQSRTYTLSSAQVLLAISSYGANMVTLNTPETYEYFCGATLLFFLNAFAGHPVQLRLFMRMLDSNWEGIGDTVKENQELSFSRPGKVLFTSTGERMPYDPLAPSDGDEETTFGKLIGEIKDHTQDSPICVMSPPQSPFADCFIVVGKCLLLIQCKRTQEQWGGSNQVKEELNKMGFHCGAPGTDQGEAFANARAFVTALKDALGLEVVIPVFCGDDGFHQNCRAIKGSGYGYEVHSMFFTPHVALTVELTKTTGAKEWQVTTAGLVPQQLRPRGP